MAIYEKALEILEQITTLRNNLGLPADTPLSEVVGSASSGGGGGGDTPTTTDIYRVKTIAQRDALTGVPQNALCVVIDKQQTPITEDTQITKITLVPSVTLPTAIGEDDYLDTTFRSADGSIDFMCSLNPHGMNVMIWDMGTGDMFDAMYETSDGITFELMGSVTEFELSAPVTCEYGWDDRFGLFVTTTTNNFEGIFIREKNLWNPANIGITTSANKIVPGYSAYTNEGVVAGSLGESINSANDLIDINTVLLSLQNYKPTSLRSFFSHKNISNISPVLSAMDLSNVTDYSYMCNSVPITEFDFNSLDFSNFANARFDALEGMLEGGMSTCSIYNIEKLNELNAEGMFANQPTGYGPGEYSFNRLFNNCRVNNMPGLEKLTGEKCSNFQDFISNTALEEIDLSSLVSSGCDGTAQYEGMLTANRKAKRILLPKFDFSNGSTTKTRFYDSIFKNCESLEFLDIRSSSFIDSSSTSYNDMFTGVPANCLIIVKSNTEKNFLLKVRSDLTNIKTVAEYEGN